MSYFITRPWKMNFKNWRGSEGKGVGQLGKWVLILDYLEVANNFLKPWSCQFIILYNNSWWNDKEIRTVVLFSDEIP